MQIQCVETSLILLHISCILAYLALITSPALHTKYHMLSTYYTVSTLFNFSVCISGSALEEMCCPEGGVCAPAGGVCPEGGACPRGGRSWRDHLQAADLLTLVLHSFPQCLIPHNTSSLASTSTLTLSSHHILTRDSLGILCVNA